MPKLKRSSTIPANRPEPADDPDHHLVANRGFWWVCCSINATPRTKEKLGYSLGTKCLLTARLRRDFFLQGLHDEGLELRIRRHSSVRLGKVAEISREQATVPWQVRVEQVLARCRVLELPEEARVREADGVLMA